jgi:hypothetical protein
LQAWKEGFFIYLVPGSPHMADEELCVCSGEAHMVCVHDSLVMICRA